MIGRMYIVFTDGAIANMGVLHEVPSLQKLRAIVGGSIEAVPFFHRYGEERCIVFCNEEGKLHNLPLNRTATELWRSINARPITDVLVGDIVILAGDDEFLEQV